MSRVSDTERERFHDFLDQCIDKLNSDKNKKKPHWGKETIQEHRDELIVEVHELNSKMNRKDQDGIISECKDVVNRTMFIVDGLCNLIKIKGV